MFDSDVCVVVGDVSETTTHTHIHATVTSQRLCVRMCGSCVSGRRRCSTRCMYNPPLFEGHSPLLLLLLCNGGGERLGRKFTDSAPMHTRARMCTWSESGRACDFTPPVALASRSQCSEGHSALEQADKEISLRASHQHTFAVFFVAFVRRHVPIL